MAYKSKYFQSGKGIPESETVIPARNLWATEDERSKQDETAVKVSASPQFKSKYFKSGGAILDQETPAPARDLWAPAPKVDTSRAESILSSATQQWNAGTPDILKPPVYQVTAPKNVAQNFRNIGPEVGAPTLAGVEGLLNDAKKSMADEQMKAIGFGVADEKKVSGLQREITTLTSMKDKLEQQWYKNNGYRDATLYDITLGSYDRGYTQADQGKAAFRELAGLDNNAQGIAKQLEGERYKFNPTNPIAKAVSGASELLGQQVNQFVDPRTLGMAATGASMGAMYGSAAGPFGSGITAAGGAVAGLTAGSAVGNFEIEAGSAYQEMIENGVTPETAKVVATAVGAGNAALELVQLDELTKSFKVLADNPATSSFAQKVWQEIVRRTGDAAKETVQELGQEGVSIAGTQFATKKDTGKYAYTTKEVTDRLKDTAASSFLSFGAMNVPSGVNNVLFGGPSPSAQNAPSPTVNTPQADTVKQVAPPAVPMGTLQEVIAQRDQNGTVTNSMAERVLNDAQAVTELEEMTGANLKQGTASERRGMAKAALNLLPSTTTQETATVAPLAPAVAETKPIQGLMLPAEQDAARLRGETVPTKVESMTAPTTQVPANRSYSSKNFYQPETAAYVGGMIGQKRDTVRENGLSTDQVDALYQEGADQAEQALQNDIDNVAYATLAGSEAGFVKEASHLTKDMDDNDAAFLNRVGKKINRKIVAFEADSKVDGYIKGDTIYFNVKSETPLRTIIAHEVTHAIQDVAPADYKAYRDYAMNTLAALEGQDVSELIARKQGIYAEHGQTLTVAQAMDEISAEFTGQMLERTDLFNTMAQENPTVAKRVLDGLKAAIAKIQNIFGKNRNARDQFAQNHYGVTFDQLKTAADLWQKAYDSAGEVVSNMENTTEAQKNTQGQETEVSAEPRFSINVSKQEYAQIQSARMQKYATSRKEMVARDFIFAHDMWYAIENDGLDDFSVILKLDPGTQANRIKVVEEWLKNGSIGAHKGAYSDISMLRLSQGYRDGDYTDARDGRTGGRDADLATRLPRRPTRRGDGNTKSAGNPSRPRKYWITTDSEGHELSQEQAEYFEDSKVRDGAGALVPVYHGSENKFTTFSHQFIGEHGKAEGSGFYFTDDKSMAQGYENDSGQLLEGYLNIKKPLSQTEVTLSRKEVSDLVKKLDPTGDDLLSSYDSSGIGYPSKAWYNRALADTLDAVINSSDSDGDIVAEISNVYGDTKGVLAAVNDLLGYDGYIVKGKYNGTVFVAFDSNQFKNTDNLTPTSDPDIRYSLRDSTESDKEAATLRKEAARLNEQVDYWKGQTKRTTKVTTDKKAVLKEARALNKAFEGNVPVDELSADMQSLYDYMAQSGDEVSFDEVRSRANAIAEKLIDSAVAVDDEFYQSYEGLRKELRNTTLQLTKEESADFPDFNDLRKANFGRVNIEIGDTNVDQVYQSLAESYPEFFDESRTTTVQDQLAEIVSVLGDIYNVTEVNPFAQDTADAVRYASDMVIDSFFDLPQTKATFADKKAFELQETKGKAKLKQDEIAQRLASALAREKAENKAAKKTAVKDAALAGEMSQGRKDARVLRETTDRLNQKVDKVTAQAKADKTQAKEAARTTAKEAKADKEAAVEQAALAGQMSQGRADAKTLRTEKLRSKNKIKALNKSLKEVKAKRKADLETQEAKYQEKAKTASTKQKNRVIRAKINRHVSALSQRLLRPTDAKHIPQGLRSGVAKMLESINLESNYTIGPETPHKYKEGVMVHKRLKDDSGTPTKRTEAFRELKQLYEAEKDNGQMVIDDSLVGNLDEVIAMGGIKLDDMTTAQLETVWEAVKMVEQSIKIANKMLSDSRYTAISEAAEAVRRDSEGRKNKKPTKDKRLLLDMETPQTFFHHFGKAGDALYNTLWKSQDLETLRVDEVTKMSEGITNGTEVNKLESKVETFHTDGGVDLKLSRAQMMNIYLLANRKQALGHLLGTGIVQPAIESAKVPRGTTAIRLTERDLNAITSKLTEEQVSIAKQLQKIVSTTLSGWGNEASMNVFGYEKFKGGDYWAIKTAKEAVHSTVEKTGDQARSVQNMGLAQQLVPEASNELDIGSVFDVYAQSASDMITYSVWLAPMLDMNRIFNFSFRDQEGKVTQRFQSILDEKAGTGGADYWFELMKDIQNGISPKSDSTFGKQSQRMIARMKKASVGSNISVVLQQPTAFFRASAVLNSWAMTRGLAGGVTKGSGWKKALQYAPIASRKSRGGFDISSSFNVANAVFDKRTKLEKADDFMTGAASATADNVTWGALWNACEWQVSKAQPDLKPGSKAFYQAVAEQFNEVVTKTQVVDGVLQRSQVMRSSDGLVKQFTAFMGEPTKSWNMMASAWDDFTASNGKTAKQEAGKVLVRTGTAFLSTAIVNSLVRSMVGAMRDDDGDKEYWEKVFSRFTGIAGDEASMAEYAKNIVLDGEIANALNPVTMMPLFKDAWSILQGWSVDRTDLDGFGDFIKSSQSFMENIGGNGDKTIAYAVKDLATAASKVFGLSQANILRDMWALGRTAAYSSGNIPLQYEMEKAIYNLSNSGNAGRYYSILYRALEQGDMDGFRMIRTDMIDTMDGMNVSKINSAMRARYTDAKKGDPDYSISFDALDEIAKNQMYEGKEKDKEITPADLTSKQAEIYTEERSEDYRALRDAMEKSGLFKSLDGDGKNKAINSADSLASDYALEKATGGKEKVDTDWMEWATGGKSVGVDAWEAILFKTAYDLSKSDKDKDGKTISGSKKENTLEMASSMLDGMNQEQINYLLGQYWKVK